MEPADSSSVLLPPIRRERVEAADRENAAKDSNERVKDNARQRETPGKL